jgi:hypothetical protein
VAKIHFDFTSPSGEWMVKSFQFKHCGEFVTNFLFLSFDEFTDNSMQENHKVSHYQV